MHILKHLDLIRFSRTARQFALTAAAAWTLAGCATLIRGPNTDFNVVTEPPGASVTTNLEVVKWDRSDPEYHSCSATPCAFEISRKSEFEVVVTLEGYHPATVQVTSGFGRGGAQSSAAGAVTGATGAYIVSYSLISSTASALSAVATAGMSSSAASAGAGSAAATGAAGIGVLFLGVDLVSGAMLDLRPNPLALVMIPIDQPLPEIGDEYLTSEDALEEALKKSAPGSE
ncbi:MAG: hypothetical protein AAFQ24_07105 [Pseudomonadota bacterium]